MKKKGNFRKVVSGLLAGMTILSTVLSPMTAYAAEIQPAEKPPLYEEVKDLLDEDEVVTAKDYEMETGSVFDVKSDWKLRMITRSKSHLRKQRMIRMRILRQIIRTLTKRSIMWNR